MQKTIVIYTNIFSKIYTHDMFETQLSQLYNAGRYKHRFLKSISH